MQISTLFPSEMQQVSLYFMSQAIQAPTYFHV